jgi:hypothetical protein
MECRVGHMEVEAGAAEARVPQQQWDTTQVDTGLEQMGGKSVPERFDILLHLIDKH